MQISGTILQVLANQSGLSINGAWSKQNIIVETTDDYPKKVCISIWNGKVDVTKLEIGKKYLFHCNIESKEFKEKWYTEISLWKIVDYEPEFPDVDIDELAKSVVGSGSGMNLNEFLSKNTEIAGPDFSKAIAKGTAANMPGRVSELPISLKISANEHNIVSMETTPIDDSGSDKNTPEENPENLNPFFDKLKIDPEKVKEIQLTRKINNFEKEEEDLDDSVFII